ncbi:TPA: hypothetical protein ACH3X3_007042 [Trebouxia sp. C0006]
MQRQQLNLLSHTNSLACCHQLTSRNINSLSNSRLARQRISYRPTVLAANSDRNPHSSRINDVALLSHQNGVYTVGGSIQTPVSTSHVYDMLIDYPNLNRVFSSIDECHTLSEQSALQLLQLTGTPDGGCHVEHKLKVQPVLDAPALFSGYAQRIFVKQVTKVLEDLLAALKTQEQS